MRERAKKPPPKKKKKRPKRSKVKFRLESIRLLEFTVVASVISWRLWGFVG